MITPNPTRDIEWTVDELNRAGIYMFRCGKAPSSELIYIYIYIYIYNMYIYICIYILYIYCKSSGISANTIQYDDTHYNYVLLCIFYTFFGPHCGL